MVSMVRARRVVVFALLVAASFAATACAEPTSPRNEDTIPSTTCESGWQTSTGRCVGGPG